MTLFDKFIKYIRYELNLSAHTVLSYGNDLNQFVRFLSAGGCDVSLSENEIDAKLITASDVRSWMAHLSESGVSSRSVHRKLQSLRAFFRYAMKQGQVENNPCDDVRLAKVRPRLPVYIRPGAMERVLDEDVDRGDFTEVRDRLIVEVLYDTGMRRAELIGLLDADVDVVRGELKVLGKRNKERIIPIGHSLCESIAVYRRLRMRVAGEAERFFVRPGGEPLYESLVYRVVRKSLSGVVSGKCSPHVLRHSFASAMLNNGAEINSVKELLGHQSLAATQVYTHISIRELKSNYQQAHPRAIKKGG